MSPSREKQTEEALKLGDHVKSLELECTASYSGRAMEASQGGAKLLCPMLYIRESSKRYARGEIHI